MGGASSVGGDVVIEGIALESQQDEVTPVGVVHGGDIMDDWNQGLDLLDAGNLGVEADDSGCLKCSINRPRCL
jgi:hypothetical protein